MTEYTDNTEDFNNTSTLDEKSIEFSREGEALGKLYIPGWIREQFPDKFLRWFRFDQPRMNRAAQLRYEFVPADQYPEIVKAIGDFDLGANNTNGSDKIVRTGDLGTKMVLMMLDKKIHEIYQEQKAKKNKAKLEGTNPTAKGFENSKTKITTNHLE